MIDARTEELINAAIDGNLDVDGQLEFEHSLTNSSEAREYHASLKSLDTALRTLPQLGVPHALRDETVAGIQLPPASHTKPPAITRLRSRGQTVALAASIAVAMAAGLYLLQYESAGTANYNDMTGTIAPEHLSSMAKDTFKIVGAELNSNASLVSNADGAVLEITLDSENTIDLSIDLSDAGLRFDAFDQARSTPEDYSVTDNVIRARGRGRHEFAVVLHRTGDAQPQPGARITIDYFRDGALIQQRTLEVRAP